MPGRFNLSHLGYFFAIALQHKISDALLFIKEEQPVSSPFMEKARTFQERNIKRQFQSPDPIM